MVGAAHVVETGVIAGVEVALTAETGMAEVNIWIGVAAAVTGMLAGVEKESTTA